MKNPQGIDINTKNVKKHAAKKPHDVKNGKRAEHKEHYHARISGNMFKSYSR